jgi:hypothetical protein
MRHASGKVYAKIGGFLRPVSGSLQASEGIGSGEEPPPPPPPPTEAAEIAAAAKALPYQYMYQQGFKWYAEEAAQNLLTPRPDATKVAWKSGNWSDPTVWYPSGIPLAGDKVLICQTASVLYDYVMPCANPENVLTSECLKWVRVDGEFRVKHDMTTRMLCDTLNGDMRSMIKIGTETNPIGSAYKFEFLMPGDTDLDMTNDPHLLGRGFLSMGAVQIRGETVTPYMRPAVHPTLGSSSILLDGTPVGWKVGGRIYIAGTRLRRYRTVGSVVVFVDDPEDEEAVITAISGNFVTFTTHPDGVTPRGLQYDHSGPRPMDTPLNKTRTVIGYFDRNVIFKSPASAPVHRRGHFAIMHSMMALCYGGTSIGLGRTDKVNQVEAISAFSPYVSLGGKRPDTGWTPTSNVKGRYSMHIHQAGFDDPMTPCRTYENVELCLCDAAVVENWMVHKSDGWGISLHSSRGKIFNNFTYKCGGAGIACEDGDEFGDIRWNLNARVYQGAERKFNNIPNSDGKNLNVDETGRAGVGIWMAGRAPYIHDNIACNVNSGVSWAHRAILADPIGAFADDAVPFVGLGLSTVDVNRIPIQKPDRNEVFATHWGLSVHKANPDQGHGVRSVFHDWLIWECEHGAEIAYTSHYSLIDFDIIGQRSPLKGAEPATGFIYQKNTGDAWLIRPRIEGFNVGLFLAPALTTLALSTGFINRGAYGRPLSGVVSPTFINVNWRYENLVETGAWDSGGDLALVRQLSQTLNPDVDPDRARLMTMAETNPGVLSWSQIPLLWQTDQRLVLQGTHTDALGSRPRITETDTSPLGQGLRHAFENNQLEWWLRTQGYYTFGTKKVIVVPDVIYCRLLGTRLLTETVITVGISTTRFNQLGSIPNLGLLPSQYEARVF